MPEAWLSHLAADDTGLSQDDGLFTLLDVIDSFDCITIEVLLARNTTLVEDIDDLAGLQVTCLLYTSPSPRD